MLFRLLFASLLLIYSAELISQETGTCAENLKNAQSFFEKGQVDSVALMLTECLKSGGFKKEEALTAYKLIIQTFLLNDEIEKADSAMFAFLKKYPEYILSPTDHSSFVYLFNGFKVKPVVQLAVHAGTNIPFMTFVTEHPTAGIPGSSKNSRNIGNLYLSVESKFKVAPKLEICVEAGLSQLKYINTISYLEFATTQYTETQLRLELPVSLTYDFAKFGKFTAYSRTGLGAAYSISVSSTASLTPVDRNNIGSRTGETLKRNDSRVPFDFFAQIGAGLKYKVPRGYFFAEVRTNMGMLEQNVPGGESVPLLEYYYLWRDPSFRLNDMNVNLGFTYIFYKPSKK
jgi:hypothetical protein